MNNVNIEEVKQYNANLKQYTAMSSRMQAEKEFLLKEIENGCSELSAELGIEVTKDNIQQVRDDLCAKINSTLQSGNAVLAKIASETQAQTGSSDPIGVSAGAGQVYGGVNQVPTQTAMEQAMVAPQPTIAPQPVVQPAPVNPAAVFQGYETGGFNGADELGSFM